MLKIRLEVEAMYTDAMNAMIVQKEQEVRNLQASLPFFINLSINKLDECFIHFTLDHENGRT